MLNFENMKLEFTEILEISPFLYLLIHAIKKIRIESLNILYMSLYECSENIHSTNQIAHTDVALSKQSNTANTHKHIY